MVFITAGMGGGTGTGAAPVVAEIAKEMGILTVAVVTRPFNYEGKRLQVANAGVDQLRQHVDSLIIIPNDKLLTVLGEDVTVKEAFRAADDVLKHAIAGISEVVTCPGLINLDFADVRNVTGIMGMAMMGSAEANGVDRARLATEQAIASPLLDDVTLDGARGVLVNITTAPNCLRMSEYKEIMSVVDEYAHADAERKYGTAEDATMNEGDIRVTIIATGLREGNDIENNGHLKMVRTAQATGTDGMPEMSNVVRSGRGTRAMNLGASDFANQSVMDDFEIPAMLRRQAD
jgi:cell division protein FtsZ